MEKIKLDVSACLLGENVRHDGGHKLDRFLMETLGQSIKYVPVCPEKECGLGIPREPMHLEGEINAPRLVIIHTRQDMTDRMVPDESFFSNLRLSSIKGIKQFSSPLF